jgi:hypothetical protein
MNPTFSEYAVSMKQLPDIFTSAQFWASIATLLATSGAWFTFFAAAKTSRHDTYERILNLITGIEAELDLISNWASGSKDDPGYLQSKTKQQLVDEHPDWFYPSRQIFSFETPSLQHFTSAADLNQLTGIVRPLVRLNYSIRRLFDLHRELRIFVHSQPGLYDSVVEKLEKIPNQYTPEEKVYMNIIFEMNLRIHQNLIGGEDSTDELCLYKAFRAAKGAISDFKVALRPKPLPSWYWLMHLVAALIAVNAIWQIARWFHL